MMASMHVWNQTLLSLSKYPCHMPMPSHRLPQKSMRVGGGALKRHQKQEEVTEIDTKLI